ncbi:MAG: PadR family transcriptional regulator [Chlamydiia bacterium]|nr:PadR family transcriptional regulator [Chlamydiia bacterium]
MAKAKKCPSVILGVLAIKPKSSGYDIKKMIEESLSYCWKESFGAIYPALKELAKEGLIHPEAKGNKTLYSLTSKGKKAFEAWMKEPPLEMQPRHELLLKLFFGHTISPEVIKTHLKINHERLKEKHTGLKTVEKMLKQHMKEDPGFPYWMMSLEYSKMQLESALKWTQKYLKNFNE